MKKIDWNEDMGEAETSSKVPLFASMTCVNKQDDKVPLKAKNGQKKAKIRKMKSIEKELWELCRQLCYLRDKKPDGTIDCYTCNARNIEGSNRQLGHCRPKGACHAWGKYHLNNLRWQCMRDNIHLGGMGSEFRRRLIEEHGEKYVTDFEQKDSQTIVNARDYYLELIEKYREQLKNA